MIASMPVFLCFSILLKAQDPLGQDISGDRQVGLAGNMMSRPIAVRVVDVHQLPVPDAKVIFRVVAQPFENTAPARSAELEAETVFTNIDGYAMTRLRLGSDRGSYVITARNENDIITFTQTALEKTWFLMMLFSLFGGLGLFVFGLNYGAKGLMREAGAKMRDILFSLTKNRLLTLMTGIVAALVMGSSTATAVLLVRFASNGIINLLQALGIMLGADIGTTLTVQVLAFKMSEYALLIIGIGVLARALFPRSKNWSQFILGIGLMFFSLKVLSGAALYIRVLPGFTGIAGFLGAYPVIGVLVGAGLAFALHSSAATIGLVLILCFESLLGLSAAIPLVLGANLGTTFSSLVAADTLDGRRVAVGNLIFKLVPIMVLLPFTSQAVKIMNLIAGDSARQVANFHTSFNILVAIIFLPLLPWVASFLNRVIKKSGKETERFERLDTAFLTTPPIALGEVSKAFIHGSGITMGMLEDSMNVFRRRDDQLRKKIVQDDDAIDALEEKITLYLAKINHEDMDERSARFHGGLLSAMNSLEHIGDIISKGLMTHAKKHIDGGLQFSSEGFAQLAELHGFVVATLRIATNSLATRDEKLGQIAVERHSEGYRKAKELEAKHIERLTRGVKETLETSTIHLDLISDLERINFHASEIGKAVL